MARTKQTARMSTGGKEPHIQLAAAEADDTEDPTLQPDLADVDDLMRDADPITDSTESAAAPAASSSSSSAPPPDSPKPEPVPKPKRRPIRVISEDATENAADAGVKVDTNGETGKQELDEDSTEADDDDAADDVFDSKKVAARAAEQTAEEAKRAANASAIAAEHETKQKAITERVINVIRAAFYTHSRPPNKVVHTRFINIHSPPGFGVSELRLAFLDDGRLVLLRIDVMQLPPFIKDLGFNRPYTVLAELADGVVTPAMELIGLIETIDHSGKPLHAKGSYPKSQKLYADMGWCLYAILTELRRYADQRCRAYIKLLEDAADDVATSRFLKEPELPAELKKHKFFADVPKSIVSDDNIWSIKRKGNTTKREAPKKEASKKTKGKPKASQLRRMNSSSDDDDDDDKAKSNSKGKPKEKAKDKTKQKPKDKPNSKAQAKPSTKEAQKSNDKPKDKPKAESKAQSETKAKDAPAKPSKPTPTESATASATPAIKPEKEEKNPPRTNGTKRPCPEADVNLMANSDDDQPITARPTKRAKTDDTPATRASPPVAVTPAAPVAPPTSSVPAMVTTKSKDDEDEGY